MKFLVKISLFPVFFSLLYKGRASFTDLVRELVENQGEIPPCRCHEYLV